MTGAPLERMRAVRRRGEVLRGILAVIGALGIVVAVPLGVLVVAGVPLPDGEPSGMFHVDRPAMYTVQGAACLLLLCWLQLTICLVVEAVAGLRGSGLPRRVPFALGMQQDLARTLVTPALLIRDRQHGLRSADFSTPSSSARTPPTGGPAPGSAPAFGPGSTPASLPWSAPGSAPGSAWPTTAAPGAATPPPPPALPSAPPVQAASLPPPATVEIRAQSPAEPPHQTCAPAIDSKPAGSPEPAAGRPPVPVPSGKPAPTTVGSTPPIDRAPTVGSAPPVDPTPAAPPAEPSTPAPVRVEESPSTSERSGEPATSPADQVPSSSADAAAPPRTDSQPTAAVPVEEAPPTTAPATPSPSSPSSPPSILSTPAAPDRRPESPAPDPAAASASVPAPASAPATRAPATAPRPEPASARGVTDAGPPAPPSVPTPVVPAAAAVPAAVPVAAGGGRAVDVPWDLVDAGLLCAGLLDVVGERRRAQARTRRPGTPVPAMDSEAASVDLAIRLGADAAAATFVDQALRALADGVVQQDCPVPDIYAARMSGQYLDLFLAAPVAQAPAPFRAEAGGGRWRISREIALPKMDGVPAPLPALVSLGSSQGSRLLLDLESTGGPVSVDGDRDRARSLVVAAALELATSRSADDVHVTLVGFGHVVDSVDPERLHCVDSLDEALDAVCARLDRLHRTLAGIGSGSLLVGRMRAARAIGRTNAGSNTALDTGSGGGSVGTELIMLASPPTPAQYARLHAQARRFRRAPFALFTAGTLPPARLRLTVDAAGVLDTGPLGVTVAAQALSPRTYLALGRLMRSVSQPDTDPTPEAAGPPQPVLQPPQSMQDSSALSARGTPASAPTLSRPVELDRSPQVLVRMLGEPALDLADPSDLSDLADLADPAELRSPAGPATPPPTPLTPLTVELCLCVALAGKLSPARLATALWPAGVGTAELTAALDAAAAFLGTDEKGVPRLRLVDGVLSLSEDVGLDWHRFVALVERGGAGDVDRALRLVRGAPAEPPSPGRYSWLAREPAVREAMAHVVDVAHRRARQCLGRGDHDGAVTAARAGLRAEPVSNALWDDLAEAIRERDGAAAAEELLRTREPH